MLQPPSILRLHAYCIYFPCLIMASLHLNKIKGTANEKQLCKIMNQRLNLPHDSPYRMQSLCDQIPATLPDDIESAGYHRQGYQRFTANFHLKDAIDESASASDSQWHHSPCKL